MRHRRPAGWFSMLFTAAVACLLLMAVPSASAAEVKPHTVLLTWQQDPTTTMTVQWLQRGDLLPLAEGQDESLEHAHGVPQIEAPPADADATWDGPALHVPLMLNEAHRVPNPDSFDAELKLGWTEAGLFLRVAVRDLTPSEHPDRNDLWRADSVELFVSTGVGDSDRYQLILASGADPEQDGLRMQFYDSRADRAVDLTAETSSAVHDEGYTIDVLLPWENLGLDAVEAGRELAFNAIVNDAGTEEASQWLGWHHHRDSSRNSRSMMPLKLTDGEGTQVLLRTVLKEDHLDTDKSEAQFFAHPDLAGKTITLHAGDEVVGSTTLEGDELPLHAAIPIPAPPEDERWGALSVELDDERVAVLEMSAIYASRPPDAAELLYRAAGESEFQTAETAVHRMIAWPGVFRQRVELTGLEPASTYEFQIPGVDRTFKFRTMPTDIDEPLRFATGGDIRHRQDWMEATNRQAMKYDIDFVVWGGDFAYADAMEERLYRWDEWFQANYNTLISDDGRVVPVVAGIGNHEVRGGYMVNQDDYEPTDEYRLGRAPYFFQLFAFPGQPGYGVLDFGDYLSIVLPDTNHANPIAGEQTDWLASVLAEREHVPHVFPVYHVPAYPSHRPYDGGVSRQVREHWVPLFEEHGIEVVFENHDHTYKRTHPLRGGEVDPHRGIVYMGDGAWGVGTRDVHDVEETWYLRRAESTRHAIIVTLHGRHRHMLVVSEDGDILDEYPQTPLNSGLGQ
ncbi:sugar-binding protein [Phycisphaerales bacterium AB-hyl4]|uniref:Sugar-binding protein n=1 Tax=Natronomicrosphaera hydrolytica TaxID=3242702 RepID=A0ABV4U896_9BACT